jgi:hypothetical protein
MKLFYVAIAGRGLHAVLLAEPVQQDWLSWNVGSTKPAEPSPAMSFQRPADTMNTEVSVLVTAPA